MMNFFNIYKYLKENMKQTCRHIEVQDDKELN